VMALNRKAVKGTDIQPTNYGYYAAIHVRLKENDTWEINGETCVDPFDAASAVMDILYSMNAKKRYDKEQREKAA
jgi:hypothetical protein